MSKHTPGPWKIRIEGTTTGRGPEVYVDGEYYDGGGEFVVAECGVTETNVGTRWKRAADADTKDANASLISAAPDLLAALKGVLRIADRKTDEFDAAHAAIAKAEGA